MDCFCSLLSWSLSSLLITGLSPTSSMVLSLASAMLLSTVSCTVSVSLSPAQPRPLLHSLPGLHCSSLSALK